jgi:hypothetical protein
VTHLFALPVGAECRRISLDCQLQLGVSYDYKRKGV